MDGVGSWEGIMTHLQYHTPFLSLSSNVFSPLSWNTDGTKPLVLWIEDRPTWCVLIGFRFPFLLLLLPLPLPLPLALPATATATGPIIAPAPATATDYCSRSCYSSMLQLPLHNNVTTTSTSIDYSPSNKALPFFPFFPFLLP